MSFELLCASGHDCVQWFLLPGKKGLIKGDTDAFPLQVRPKSRGCTRPTVHHRSSRMSSKLIAPHRHPYRRTHPARRAPARPDRRTVRRDLVFSIPPSLCKDKVWWCLLVHHAQNEEKTSPNIAGCCAGACVRCAAVEWRPFSPRFLVSRSGRTLPLLVQA